MKMPKKKQLYDVCLLQARDGVNYWISTPKPNIPVAMARFYVRTLKCSNAGEFYIYVKNGLNPITVLLERKAKKLKIDAPVATRCPYCNCPFNPACTEQTNCLTVTLEAELAIKNLNN